MRKLLEHPNRYIRRTALVAGLPFIIVAGLAYLTFQVWAEALGNLPGEVREFWGE